MHSNCRISPIARASYALVLVSTLALADPAMPTGTAGMLIKHYQMQIVPQEGVWFSLSYASSDKIDGDALPSRYAGLGHAAGSAIMVVETPRDFSAMHRLQTDEVWHFYAGSPIKLVLLYPDGHGQTVVLGADVSAGQTPQFTVPHGVWQGSVPRGVGANAYSFAGTQLSPGFDYADFEIGYRDELQKKYPMFSRDIKRLTRDEFAQAAVKQTGVSLATALRPGAILADAPLVTVSPGVILQELVGRVARDAKTSSVSVAKFTLSPGRSSDYSFNKRAQEVFLVTDGTGTVRVGDKVIPVTRDATVFIPAMVAHSIEADSNTVLTFYAISAPAFTPDDYVVAPR